MHSMDKNAKVIIIYSLNLQERTLSQKHPTEAKLPGHSSSLAEFQMQCKWGPRMLCIGIQGLSSCPKEAVQDAQTVVHSDFPHPVPCGEPWKLAPLGSRPHCVWKRLCELEQVLWPSWISAFSFLVKISTQAMPKSQTCGRDNRELMHMSAF